MRQPGIDTGPADSAKRMLVYFDPNCLVCAQQWQVLRAYLDTGYEEFAMTGRFSPFVMRLGSS